MKPWVLILSLIAVLGLSSCTRAGAGTAAAAPPPEPQAEPQAASFDGPGLLQSACTTCHDLSAITSNPGAYTEADFRDTIFRMVGYGAPITDAQIEPLTAYLTETYGP